MHQKLFATLILVAFSLILLNSATALIIYLRPPKMIIRLNTSETVERSLTVENRNNISMEINSTINGNISEVITIKNPSFEILPNETKTIDFVTKANKPGFYSGEIIVTYTSNALRPVLVPSEITVIASGKPTQNIDFVTILIIILIIIVITPLFVKYKRGSKRWGK
jgi:hypothetical protein